MTEEPINIETENIFLPEEAKEPTFDELLGDMPEPMANYLRATKEILTPLSAPFARFAPPLREQKVRVIRFGSPDPEIETQLEDLLNAGWMLGSWINTRDFVICIFSREKEGTTNG